MSAAWRSPLVLSIADRVRRLVWRLAGPRTVGVRGVVVDGAGRVLLVRHTYGPERWHLPGGGVKRRESLVDGLQRELREEVGVILEASPSLLGTYSSLTEGKSDHITVFVVEHWHRDPADSPEIDAQQFFSADALPSRTSPGSRRRIEEWSSGAAPQTFTW